MNSDPNKVVHDEIEGAYSEHFYKYPYVGACIAGKKWMARTIGTGTYALSTLLVALVKDHRWAWAFWMMDRASCFVNRRDYKTAMTKMNNRAEKKGTPYLRNTIPTIRQLRMIEVRHPGLATWYVRQYAKIIRKTCKQ